MMAAQIVDMAQHGILKEMEILGLTSRELPKTNVQLIYY